MRLRLGLVVENKINKKKKKKKVKPEIKLLIYPLDRYMIEGTDLAET